MAVREIIKIDEELCDGCGDCVVACEEGALAIVDGKAKLVKEIYCDGFGACVGECPQDALTMEKREAAEFDQAAVERHLATQKSQVPSTPSMSPAGGCPGSAMQQMTASVETADQKSTQQLPSQLGHWPVQLRLIPPHAPFLKSADLVICADCVPFTVPDFHSRYLSNRAVVVGCPKLDNLQEYFAKFKELFAQATPRRVTVLIMEVPCCTGLAQAAYQARNEVMPETVMEVHTIGIRGGIDAEKVPAAGTPETPVFNIMG